MGANILYNVTKTASITGVHAQTLRHYEKIGLVVPKRTIGGVRRYSVYDIEKLQAVTNLTANGINLEGVKIILNQQEELNILRRQLQAQRDGAVFTGSDLGISVEQYSAMSIRERTRLLREIRKKQRHQIHQLQGRTPLQITL